MVLTYLAAAMHPAFELNPAALSQLYPTRLYGIPESSETGTDGESVMTARDPRRDRGARDNPKDTTAALIALPPGGSAPDAPGADLIDRILSSVGLERVSCMWLDTSPLPPYTALRGSLPLVVLAFGPRPGDFGLHLRESPSEPLLFGGTCWIFAPAPEELAGDEQAKRSLWKALQEVFHT